MAIVDIIKRSGRGLAVAAALVGAVSLTAPSPARANVSPGWAAAIGLGSFALGTAVGSSAAYPYGYYGGYPYGGYYAPPAPAYYYPPAPYYPRTCWDPYYRRYYSC